MKRWLGYLVATAVFAACGVGWAAGQREPRPGTVIVPPTSVEHPQDIGVRSHTNFLIFVPAAKKGRAQATNAAPSGETPSSLACIYQTGPNNDVPNCPISYTSNSDIPTGGSNVIAIVDAYDYPTAQKDFDKFSTQFGLPLSTATCGNGPCFTKVYATGTQPSANCGWAQEAALDIEWAHAMAPHAQIILVEAASNSNSDLLQAVQVASNEVVCGAASCPNGGSGVGEVSMSWGSSEFRGESVYDTNFTTPGVTYFASSGDSGGKVIWPSASPDVVSAGGTTINRDGNGNFTGESAWSSAGGGASKVELVPDYQSVIYSLSQLLGQYRGTPDLSFDADPNSGVSVYDSTSCQGYVDWMVFGGTSVASPSLSGIVNLSGAFDGGWDDGTNSASVQSNLYDNYSNTSSAGTVCNYGQSQSTSAPFYDVTTGSVGRYSATGCWDFATGIGTLRGITGLSGSTSSSGSFSLSASPRTGSVTEGQSGSWTPTITATSSGFTGKVSLSATCSNCSTNTVSFNLLSKSISLTTGGTGTASLAVTASNTAPAGTYTINVTGSSSGVPSSSTTFVVTVNPASSGGDFSISASPSNVIISPKGSTSYTITVGSVSGFSGSVTLSVSESIPQSRATISPDPVTVSSGGSATSTLTVSTGPKTPTSATPYTISITGTSGSLTHSTSVSLTVQ